MGEFAPKTAMNCKTAVSLSSVIGWVAVITAFGSYFFRVGLLDILDQSTPFVVKEEDSFFPNTVSRTLVLAGGRRLGYSSLLKRCLAYCYYTLVDKTMLLLYWQISMGIHLQSTKRLSISTEHQAAVV